MASNVWCDRRQAAGILDVDERAVDRLIAEGLIGTRRLAGVRARLRRDDIEAIARNALVPASRPPAYAAEADPTGAGAGGVG